MHTEAAQGPGLDDNALKEQVIPGQGSSPGSLTAIASYICYFLCGFECMNIWEFKYMSL